MCGALVRGSLWQDVRLWVYMHPKVLIQNPSASPKAPSCCDNNHQLMVLLQDTFLINLLVTGFPAEKQHGQTAVASPWKPGTALCVRYTTSRRCHVGCSSRGRFDSHCLYMT